MALVDLPTRTSVQVISKFLPTQMLYNFVTLEGSPVVLQVRIIVILMR